MLVFLISNTPRLILNLTEFAVHGKGEGFSSCGCDMVPTWYTIMISVNHLFLTINRFVNIRQGLRSLILIMNLFSSINFLIYCSVGDKFKKVLCRFFSRIIKMGPVTGMIN